MIEIVVDHFLRYVPSSNPHYVTKKTADFDDKYLANVFPYLENVIIYRLFVSKTLSFNIAEVVFKNYIHN